MDNPKLRRIPAGYEGGSLLVDTSGRMHISAEATERDNGLRVTLECGAEGSAAAFRPYVPEVHDDTLSECDTCMEAEFRMAMTCDGSEN